MSSYETETGLEFGEAEYGEFGEAEYGEFGEAEYGELGEAEYGELGEAEYGELGEFGEFGEFGEAEYGEFGEFGEASPLAEAEQIQLASELLEISSEEELEQFLGGLFKKVARGVGGLIKSPVGRALGGVLKSVAKKALPVVGGALGSMLVPGIGTAVGTKLGSLASGLFEVELEGLPAEQAEFEVARRYVNLAATAARNAAMTPPRPGANPRAVARAAVAQAARTYAPGVYRGMMRSRRAGAVPVLGRPPYRPAAAMGAGAPNGVSAAYGQPPVDIGGPGLSGRWVRRGRRIVLFGV